MALAALSTAAVLDVGSTTAEAAPSVSPFAGSWSGTWSHVGEDVVGTWDDWTISDAGRISGTLYSITNNYGGRIVGDVDADGNLVMIGVAYPGAFPFHGTAVIDGDGKLVVSVTGTWSGAFSLVGILERN
jgi:hypothetical protein